MSFQPHDYIALRVAIQMLLIAVLCVVLFACAAPSNHRLLCYNEHIDIDISAAWLCHPQFNRSNP